MVVKEYLEDEGIALDRFQQHRRSVSKQKHLLSKMLGGDISVPVPRKNGKR